MRAVPMTSPPSTGSAPPGEPGAGAARNDRQLVLGASRTQAATSSVVAGNTTIRGRMRYPSRPSHSYVRNSLAALTAFRAPTMAAKRS